MITNVIHSSLSARFLVLACFAGGLFPAPATASSKKAPADHWVGTWAAAPFAHDNTAGPDALGSAATTIRETVHTSLAGSLVRIVLTNEFGSEPLEINSAHIALAGKKAGTIALPSAHALTFHGLSHVTIPPGETAASDPAALHLPAESNLVVSLYLPAQTISHLSFHESAQSTVYRAPGNVVRARSLPAKSVKTAHSWYFLQSVEVKTAAAAGAIVAFGDSITDGAGSTRDANTRWPDVLARRLQADKATDNFSVLNEGIGGNRILHDGTGPSALHRFDRDVLGQAGVRAVILLEGINDIGVAGDPTHPKDPVTADDLIQGLTQLAERAHAKDVKVFGATLTPYLGAGYSSPTGETMREAVNTWIRTTKVLDGFIDFAKVTTDPDHPDTLRTDYQGGDHLHPNDAGYKVMGDAIDLQLITAPGK